MKKLKLLSLLLSLVLVFQCLALPVLAEETTETTEPIDQAVLDILAGQEKQATFGTVSIQNGCRTINGMVPLGGNERKLNSAQGAFLYEVNTGTVVYSYNPDVKLAPGSLAKIVNALVALEMCELDDVVTVSSRNISKLPVGSNLNPKDGEQLTIRDLLHAMLLISDNAAAVAVAEHVAGNQQAYTTLMNQRVKQMGCTSTEFGNVHGLDTAASHTTARDMVRITMEALKNEDFAEIFSAVNYKIPPTNKTEKERKFDTMNYFLSQAILTNFYDDRVTGGVQVFSTSAGASMACTAESKGMKYVAVVIGCLRVNVPDSWRVQTYGNVEEIRDLLEFGFEKFKVNRILYNGMSLKQFPVAGGESGVVTQCYDDYDSVVPISASMDNLNIKYFLDEGSLDAPVAKDKRIGTLEIWYRNSCMAEAEMFAMSGVKKAVDTGVTIRSTAVRSDSDSSGVLSVIGTICVIILGLAGSYLTFNAYMRSRIRAQRRRRREARRRNY